MRGAAREGLRARPGAAGGAAGSSAPHGALCGVPALPARRPRPPRPARMRPRLTAARLLRAPPLPPPIGRLAASPRFRLVVFAAALQRGRGAGLALKGTGRASGARRPLRGCNGTGRAALRGSDCAALSDATQRTACSAGRSAAQGPLQRTWQSGACGPLQHHAARSACRTGLCAHSVPLPPPTPPTAPMRRCMPRCSTGPRAPPPTAPITAHRRELQRCHALLQARAAAALQAAASAPSLAAPQHRHGLLHRSHHHSIHLQRHPWAQRRAAHPHPPQTPPPYCTPGPAAIASPHGRHWRRPPCGQRSPGTETSAPR